MAVLALVICAWFAVGIRQSHELAVATRIIAATGQPTPHALAVAAGALNAADSLNPDQEVAILRGRIAIKRGQTALAGRLLAAVTRREPLNLEAWIWYTGASLGDHAAAARGAARIAQLDPRDARAVGR
jgi:hypothetical protein